MKRLALALIALPLAAASLDQLLSSPFPDDLVAQPNGDAVAWVSDAAGVRNVFVARAPEFKPLRITNFNADDGREISDISWRKDGSALVFSRGKEIWLGRESAPTHKIGDGHSPVLSPDGGFAAWIQKGQVWVMPPIGKPYQLFEDRGENSELTWSPDSTRLAFTSTRTDHAFIGIYDLKNKTLTFPDPSVDTDRSPSWSPDGSKLAFIRVPAFRDPTGWGQSPRPTGQPWSIRVIDTRPHELWKASEGMGSVYWPISAAHQLMWTANDRIVFAWEHDGWQHLYAIPAAGGEPALLTPGNFEVEHATLSVDGNSVVFSSNQGDLDRKHLWQVSFDGEAPRILTAGQGIEWQPAALSSNRVALIHSDAKTPAQVGVLINSQIRDLAAIAPWPLVEPKPVINQNIHYQLFLPATEGKPEGKHPAVIFFHGGPRRQMVLGWNEMQYYHRAYAFNQYLVSKGYVVLSVNYHSGVGYGLNFREYPHYGATGASEYPDVLAAGEYLRTRADVDPDRIGLWGGSYGGYLTALGLARNSNIFKVGVDLHGIHDWNLELPVPISTAFGSSPLAAIKMWRSPVLIIQGDDDHNVNFANSVQVIEALRRQGVPFEQLIFPDEVHDFTVHAHWLAAYHAAEAFLDKYLKP